MDRVRERQLDAGFSLPEAHHVRGTAAVALHLAEADLDVVGLDRHVLADREREVARNGNGRVGDTIPARGDEREHREYGGRAGSRTMDVPAHDSLLTRS